MWMYKAERKWLLHSSFHDTKLPPLKLMWGMIVVLGQKVDTYMGNNLRHDHVILQIK